jgi:hypothetical protein
VWTTQDEFEAQREGHEIQKMMSLLFSLFLSVLEENLCTVSPMELALIYGSLLPHRGATSPDEASCFHLEILRRISV